MDVSEIPDLPFASATSVKLKSCFPHSIGKILLWLLCMMNTSSSTSNGWWQTDECHTLTVCQHYTAELVSKMNRNESLKGLSKPVNSMVTWREWQITCSKIKRTRRTVGKSKYLRCEKLRKSSCIIVILSSRLCFRCLSNNTSAKCCKNSSMCNYILDLNHHRTAVTRDERWPRPKEKGRFQNQQQHLTRD